MIFFWNNPIHPLLSTWIALGRSQKKSNFVQGLNNAILAIIQEELGWPCPVGAALPEKLWQLKDFLFWFPTSYECLKRLVSKARDGTFFCANKSNDYSLSSWLSLWLTVMPLQAHLDLRNTFCNSPIINLFLPQYKWWKGCNKFGFWNKFWILKMITE